MPGKQALNMQATPLMEPWDAFARHAVHRFAAVQHCDTDFGVFVNVKSEGHTGGHKHVLQAKHYWTYCKQSSPTAAILNLISWALDGCRVSERSTEETEVTCKPLNMLQIHFSGTASHGQVSSSHRSACSIALYLAR